MTKGSCLCGDIRFEVTGEFDLFYLCHCSYCRKDTGSAHAANLFAPNGRLTWLSGEALVSTFHLPSTRHVKSFCKQCGSAMPTYEAGVLVVPAGSIDGALSRWPDAHIFVDSRADWDQQLDNVPSIEGPPS